ncbi:hypothetical protein ALC56_01336, partial [Trachymyrmex septentrionalis]
ISKDNLEEFKDKALLIDHSTIDFKSLFKAKTSLLKHRMSERICEELQRTARIEEKRGKGLYMRTCCVRFVRND